MDAAYGRGNDDQTAAGYPPAQAAAGTGYQQPGYPDDASEAVWPGEGDPGTGYGWADDDPLGAGAADPWSTASQTSRGLPGAPLAGNAVRGFPPAPGESLPVYPPGPFAAWNRATSDQAHADRARADRTSTARGARPAAYGDSSRHLTAATITPDEFDTDYSIPAIKDPVLGSRGGAGRRAPAADASLGQPRASRAGARPTGKGGARPRSRARRQPVWLAIGAAVAIVAAVAVILVLTSPGSGPRSSPKASGKPKPVISSPTVPAGPWKYIGSRTTDSVPLTMGELYPASFTNAGAQYARIKEAKSTDCRASLIGSALQAAASTAGCTQAVRATYLARTANVMATIGVFNLESFAAAGAVATKAGHSEFVAQLVPKYGPAHKIGQGTGIEEAIVKGHYLVLVWAEFVDLRAPKAKADRVHLTSFMNLLIGRTVNVSLSNRMVDGKPTSVPGG